MIHAISTEQIKELVGDEEHGNSRGTMLAMLRRWFPAAFSPRWVEVEGYKVEGEKLYRKEK